MACLWPSTRVPELIWAHFVTNPYHLDLIPATAQRGHDTHPRHQGQSQIYSGSWEPHGVHGVHEVAGEGEVEIVSYGRELPSRARLSSV